MALSSPTGGLIPLSPPSELPEIPVATREQSGLLCFHSYHGEWTQVCVSCFFSPSPRCIWQQHLSPIIFLPAPYLSTASPCRWAPKISRQVWHEVSSEPAGRETSPDTARVTSLGWAGAPHQPSPGGAGDIASVVAPSTCLLLQRPLHFPPACEVPWKILCEEAVPRGEGVHHPVSTQSCPWKG